ncbi:unnamed protein product, partial [Mesorhabditis belari]|uniref:Galactokinase n=1 Tax=Mesorhabditis belari TaxID=2138241 RepID=A0AAF3EC45_9BILA
MRRGGWPIRKSSQSSFELDFGTSPAGCYWKRAIREITNDHFIDDRELFRSMMAEEEIGKTQDSVEVNKIKKRVFEEAIDEFRKVFGEVKIEELRAGISPGRVNLIGDHVDYVDGFVLPIALPLYTIAVARPVKSINQNFTQIHSTHFKETAKFYHYKEDDDAENRLQKWAHYAEGIFELHRPNQPLDVILHTNIPVGAGLSSSASVELALYYLFDQFNDVHLSTEKIAMLCQKAEHEYAGVPCGIMDQFVCSLAHVGHALKIDCSNLAYDRIPLAISRDASFIVVDSGVKHALASGEYAKRRAAVEQTLQVM